MSSTKVTAIPNPMDVLTVFETARYEHIPRKYAKIMLSMKIDFTNMLTRFSMILLLLVFDQ